MGLRMFFTAALCGWSAVFLAQSAPTSLTSSDDARAAAASAVVAAVAEKPLIRTKRAEEILYGNHQNAPRVKKSDPAAATSEDDVNISTNNVDSMKEDTKPLSTATDGKEAEAEQPPEGEVHNVEDVPVEVDDPDYQRYEGQEASEESDALRKKRSVKTAMMTAENMADSSISSRSYLINRPVRAKRDLDYEDLRQLFQNARDGPYKDEGDFEVVPELDEDTEDEREEQDRLGVALPYEPRYERPSEKEELLRELVERKVEEDAKEKLLDYLLAAAIASEAESTEGEDDDEESIAAPPEREDYDDARELVAAPAAIKRDTFYPYSYEPYGGRWGAMVPGTKRNSNEYDRLYRLAEALNSDEDYEEK